MSSLCSSQTQLGPLNASALQTALGQVRELAVLPHVVFKVLEASSSSSEAPASAIERVIIVDPGFSSKILVEVNSARYGLSKKVTSIREAVMYLGFKAVRNMAMTIGTFDLFVGKNDSESLRRRSWWRHSVDTAMVAKWVAYRFKISAPDDAYTVGLLHYIGKTLHDRIHGKDFDMVQEWVEREGKPDWVIEREWYGYHHGDLCEAAARKWGFPDELVSGLNYIEKPNESNALRALTHFSSAIAHYASVGQSGGSNGLVSTIPLWVVEGLGVKPADLPTMIDEAVTALAAAQMQLAS